MTKEIIFILALIIILSGCIVEEVCTESKVKDFKLQCRDGKGGCTEIYQLENGDIYKSGNYYTKNGYLCHSEYK